MTLQTREVTHGDRRVVVSEASVRIGIARYRLMREGRLLADAAQADSDMRAVLTFVYPNMIAPVVEQSGFEHWPPTPEEFASEIEESFWDRWSGAVQALNPHWFGEAEAEADDPKESPLTPPPATPTTSV